MTLTPYQGLARAAAEHTCSALSTVASTYEHRPAEGGDLVSREAVGTLRGSDIGALIKAHVEALTHAITVDFERRGNPHSFVTPTWDRPARTVLGDHTASEGLNGAIVRAVVSSIGEELQLAVMWTARFAAAAEAR